MRQLAISIDLDEVPCYSAIHGLQPPDPEAAHAVYERALPRIERWLSELGAPATFFVIGEDLAHPAAHAALERLHHAGHELANHSFHHRYDLTRQDRATMEDDVGRGSDALQELTGERPRGFRAPGYTVTDELLALLPSLGIDYDSSVFPCPGYYGAKGLALGAIALGGRRSHSILDDPRVLTAPADPYRIGAPYWRRGDGLVELPIGVTSLATGRLPFIGTSLILAGALAARMLAGRMQGRALINLELHGIDLADAEEDGLAFLAPHQPDLRRSLADKHAAIDGAVRSLLRAGYTPVTLANAAATVQ
jgi:hypothetical protein